MKVAIGAAWERRSLVRTLVQELESIDVEIVSKWHEEADAPNYMRKYLIKHGVLDLRAIRDCDCFVRLSDEITGNAYCASSLATGGHHFETGYAYSLGKIVVVVGGNQNIFDSLPNIVHVSDFSALKRFLGPVEVM